MLQVDGTLTRNTSCSESPAKGSSAANQSVFYNAPISNGSSVTPHKKRTTAAVSGNAKKAFDEVWMPAVVHNTPTDSDYCLSNQIKSNMTLIMVDKPQPSYNLLNVMK